MTLQRELSRDMDRELFSELTETPVRHVGNGNGSDRELFSELTESPVHPFLQQQFLFFKNISISEPYYLLNSSMVVLFKYILLKTYCVLTFECQTRQDTIGDVLFLYLFEFENVQNKTIYERDWLYVIQTVIH